MYIPKLFLILLTMNISAFAMEAESNTEKNETEEVIQTASSHLEECRDYFIQQHHINKIARTYKNPHIKKFCDIINQLASYHQILRNQVPETENQQDGVECIREFYDKYFNALTKLIDFQKSAPNSDDIVTLDSTEDLLNNYPIYQKAILKKCAQSVKEAKDNIAVMFGDLSLEEFSDSENEHTLKRKKGN